MNAQMEEENALVAQQQQQQMDAEMEQQQIQQQQDQQNQIAFDAQNQLAQAHIQKEVDKVNPDAGKKEQAGRDHESNMMDKKIELEKTKNKKPVAKPAPKAPAKKPAPKKKKTISEEAKELGLWYIGNNQYATNEGKVTHVADKGKLVSINE